MIDAAILDALLQAGASAEMIAAVVKAALASQEAKDEDRRARARSGNADRQRRHRERNANNAVTARDEPLSTVTSRDENVPKIEVSRAPICAGGLSGEELLIKELPTVVRKIEAAELGFEPEAKFAQSSLFAEPLGNLDDVKRRAKIAEETRIVRLVCETWNGLRAQYPRLVKVAIVPDKSTRERSILARTKDLREDWDCATPEEGWQLFFAKIRASPFLQGNSAPSGDRHPFKPMLFNLLKPELFTKILEDVYEPEIQGQRKPNGHSPSAYR